MLAAFGVLEESRRRAHHMHFVLFGGLPPRLLEGISAYPYLWAEVSRVLDSIYLAEIPREWHIKISLEKKQRKIGSFSAHIQCTVYHLRTAVCVF